MSRIKATLGRIWALVRGLFPSSRVLCDTCKYDYGHVCVRPERPNATSCPDFKRR
ncbi:MAG: hypothetical protein ACI8QS_002490 [Planctomycetota bacterium]|jgi:hypothetical protein